MKINPQQNALSQQNITQSARSNVFDQNTTGRVGRPTGLSSGPRVAINKEDPAARRKAAQKRMNQKKKDFQKYIQYLTPHELDYVKSLDLKQQNTLAAFTREDGGLDLPAFKIQQQRLSQNVASSNARAEAPSEQEFFGSFLQKKTSSRMPAQHMPQKVLQPLGARMVE